MNNKILAGIGILISVVLLWFAISVNIRAVYYSGYADGVHTMGEMLDGKSKEEAVKKHDKYGRLFEPEKEKEKE